MNDFNVPNRKNQTIITSFVKMDCIEIYKKFGFNKWVLETVLREYENFCSREINFLFDKNVEYHSLLFEHCADFRKFLVEISDRMNVYLTGLNDNGMHGDIHVFDILIQEICLENGSRRGRYYVVNIGYMNFSHMMRLRELGQNISKFVTSRNVSVGENLHTNGANGINEKTGEIRMIGSPYELLVTFKNADECFCDQETERLIQNTLRTLEVNVFSELDVILNEIGYDILKKIFNSFYNEKCLPNQIQVEIDVNSKKYYGAGIDLSRAVNNAAKNALKNLCVIKVKCNKNDEKVPNTFADDIKHLIFREFALHAPHVHKHYNSKNVISGIIQTKNYDTKTAKVVVFATGTKGINGEGINDNGNAVFDSHAEIIARRCLLNYFYDQLELHNDPCQANTSIFLKPSGLNGLYKLRDDIRFHLFISKAPCGDATLFNGDKRHVDKGKLTCKVECSDRLRQSDKINVIQSCDDIHGGTPLYTMKCSDKIARWNVVGVQGALLSMLIEPIYLDSIVLGRPCHSDNIFRAVYGRIERSVYNLPRNYYHNLPNIAIVKNIEKRDPNQREPPVSGVNWIIGHDSLETVFARSGKLENGEISRIAKQSLFRRFLNLVNSLEGLLNYSGNERELYENVKLRAFNFQIAKKECLDAFERENLGPWIIKPRAVNRFKINV